MFEMVTPTVVFKYHEDTSESSGKPGLFILFISLFIISVSKTTKINFLHVNSFNAILLVLTFGLYQLNRF